MLPQLIIAWVGPPLSGKTYCIEGVQDFCGKDRVGHHSSGDIVRRILGELCLPQDRPPCARLVKLLVGEYGPEILSNALKHRICNDQRPIVNCDSMRLLADEEMVMALPRRTLRVYVTAPERVRWERLKKRRRAGEEELSFEQFLLNEQLPTERLIREIGERADVSLIGGDDEAKNKALRLEFCQKYLVEYARA